MISISRVAFFFIGLFTIQVIANAQDWPRWRGLDQDGVVKATGLNLDWSAKKPPIEWTFRQAGEGYSAPVVVGTTLYCAGAENGYTFAFAVDVNTGSLKWKQVLGTQFDHQHGNGPRGSITVDGDKLYLIQGGGRLHCLSATDGKIIWQKDFQKDFNGKIHSGWGYSESPLVDGNLVICTPGGENGTMIALDKYTGNLVWRTKDWTDEAGYSTPVVVEVDGVRQYIQQAAHSVVGVSAKDGILLWKVEVESYNNPNNRIRAVVPTPIYQNNTVYVTAGYRAGCTKIRLTKEGEKFNTEIVYANSNMVNQHGGVVLMDGHIYGYSDNNAWTCQNIKNGEIVWTKRNPGEGKGTIIGVNNHLILLNETNGTLTVIAASPEGWKEYGNMPIPERTEISTQANAVWTHLIIANGKLYLRDHDLIFCFNLKK